MVSCALQALSRPSHFMEIQEASRSELKKNFDLGLDMNQKEKKQNKNKKAKIKTEEALST